jgi:hypothetical protein
MNIIFQIDGGLGKNIMATALCKGFKKKYPKDTLIVVTPYTDVFLNNPNVDKLYNNNEYTDFYIKYVKDKDVRIYIQDPYHHNNFQTGREHLLKTWFEMFGLEYEGEMPEFFLTKVEREHISQFYRLNKPILLLHANGGPQNGISYNWARDIPESLVFPIIEEFSKEYDIIQIRREDQLAYPNIMSAMDGYRNIAVLIEMSQKRLFIDSFSQHLAAALNKPSTVLWITTEPEIFGYGLHTNIKANNPNLPIRYQYMYQKFSLNEPLTTLPYRDTRHIFNLNSIISSLK